MKPLAILLALSLLFDHHEHTHREVKQLGPRPPEYPAVVQSIGVV